MIISTSNLVGIIDVGSMQVYFLDQYVKQTGSRNTADIQLIKCKNQWKNVSKSPKFCILTGNRGRGIGVVDSKYVGKIYPLRTGHVTWRMRSSQKRNVSGNQHETL